MEMNIGIIGYGKMGSAIFKLLTNTPHHIFVLNRSEEKAKEREEKFFKGLERSLKRGAISEEMFAKQKGSVKFIHRWEDLATADIVIETATEIYEEKVDIFHRVESVIDKNAVLVTNSSSNPIKALSEELRYQERFCGLHFFHPVLIINLVEIIKWKEDQTELVGFLKDFCNQIGKKSIVVMDQPSSVINSILSYSYVEALYVLEEGLALPSTIDDISKRFFYIGPCESMDTIGFDFFIDALKRVAVPGSILPLYWEGASQAELSETDTGGRGGFHVPKLFWRLLSENRLGRKVSKGLYVYQGDKPVDDAPEFYIDPERYASFGSLSERNELIAKRILYSVFNGSIYSLQREITSLEDLDVGMREVLHMREGPFTMMRRMGQKKVKEDFDFLAQIAGKRFRQTSLEFLNQ
jgi:3-hydroxyacyl-CoA dehydrogenase